MKKGRIIQKLLVFVVLLLFIVINSFSIVADDDSLSFDETESRMILVGTDEEVKQIMNDLNTIAGGEGHLIFIQEEPIRDEEGNIYTDPDTGEMFYLDDFPQYKVIVKDEKYEGGFGYDLIKTLTTSGYKNQIEVELGVWDLGGGGIQQGASLSNYGVNVVIYGTEVPEQIPWQLGENDFNYYELEGWETLAHELGHSYATSLSNPNVDVSLLSGWRKSTIIGDVRGGYSIDPFSGDLGAGVLAANLVRRDSNLRLGTIYPMRLTYTKPGTSYSEFVEKIPTITQEPLSLRDRFKEVLDLIKENPEDGKESAKEIIGEILENTDITKEYKVMALTNIGAVFSEVGDTESAKEFFEKAVKIEPNNILANQYLGREIVILDYDYDDPQYTKLRADEFIKLSSPEVIKNKDDYEVTIDGVPVTLVPLTSSKSVYYASSDIGENGKPKAGAKRIYMREDKTIVIKKKQPVGTPAVIGIAEPTPTGQPEESVRSEQEEGVLPTYGGTDDTEYKALPKYIIGQTDEGGEYTLEKAGLWLNEIAFYIDTNNPIEVDNVQYLSAYDENGEFFGYYEKIGEYHTLTGEFEGVTPPKDLTFTQISFDGTNWLNLFLEQPQLQYPKLPPLPPLPLQLQLQTVPEPTQEMEAIDVLARTVYFFALAYDNGNIKDEGEFRNLLDENYDAIYSLDPSNTQIIFDMLDSADLDAGTKKIILEEYAKASYKHENLDNVLNELEDSNYETNDVNFLQIAINLLEGKEDYTGALTYLREIEDKVTGEQKEYVEQHILFASIPDEIRELLPKGQNTPEAFAKALEEGNNKITLKEDKRTKITLEKTEDGGWEYSETKTKDEKITKALRKGFDNDGKELFKTTLGFDYDDEGRLKKEETIHVIRDEDGNVEAKLEANEFYTYVTLDEKEEQLRTYYEFIYDGDGKAIGYLVIEDKIEGKEVVQTVRQGGRNLAGETLGPDEEGILEDMNKKWDFSLENIWYGLETAARSPFGKLFGLFYSDSYLRKFRETVDKFFCTITLGLGDKDCVTSIMCKSYIPKTSQGVAYMDIPGVTTREAVFVTGERSKAIYPNESTTVSEYFYKLNYKIENPTQGDIYFNVHLYGDRTIPIYEEDLKLEKGKTKSLVGMSANVKYSSYLYDKICVKFNKKIRFAGKTKTDKVCNDITETTKKPTKYLPSTEEEEEEEIEVEETNW